jgi:hypothetical protein
MYNNDDTNEITIFGMILNDGCCVSMNASEYVACIVVPVQVLEARPFWYMVDKVGSKLRCEES